MKGYSFLFVISMLASVATLADSFQERLGPRALSMGGAYRAVSWGNDAIFYNPAGMFFSPRFNLDLDYVFDWTGNTHFTGASLVDSGTSALAAGLDYHIGIAPKETIELTHIGSIALAYPVYQRYLSLGLTVRYLHLPPSEGSAAGGHVTGDFGIGAYTPIGLSFAAVGYNLIPTKSKMATLDVGFGAAWNIGGITEPTFDKSETQMLAQGVPGGLTFAFDFLMRDLITSGGQDFQLHGGAEYVVAAVVPLRFGYQWTRLPDAHAITAGTGFNVENFAMDIFYQHGIKNSNRKMLGAAAKIYF